MTNADLQLPALRCLGDPDDARPTILVDTREQTPLSFCRLPTAAGTLISGDYAPRGLEHLCVVERKTAADLVASVTHERDRFERELHRLRGMHFARVLVTVSRESIGAGEYRSQANPRAVLASCDTFEIRYRVPFVFVPDDATAAALVERWVWLFCAETIKTGNALVHGLTRRPAPVGEPAPAA